MSEILAVTLGGGLGALARFLMLGIVAKSGSWPGFPLGTLCVNLLGCCLAGAMLAILEKFAPEARELKLFLMTGVLGGFTTFSSFGLEVYYLLERGQGLPAALYVAASVILGVLGVWTACSLARGLLGI